MVALLLNYDPFFPPDGSGLFGLVLALVFLKAEPFPDAAVDLAEMNLLFFSLLFNDLLDPVFLVIFSNSD
jgi:hypothetical protein